MDANKVMGVGEASGMFPIDSSACDYDRKYMEQFDELITDRHYDWKLRDILPRVLTAGEDAGCLTDDGIRRSHTPIHTYIAHNEINKPPD